MFCLCAIVPNAWPGVATSGAMGLTLALGFGNPTVVAVFSLIAPATALTISPVVYQAVEKVESFKVRAVDDRLSHRGDLRRDFGANL